MVESNILRTTQRLYNTLNKYHMPYNSLLYVLQYLRQPIFKTQQNCYKNMAR